MNEIVKQEPKQQAVISLVPKDMIEAFRLAEAVQQSGMAPYGLKNPQAIMIAMMSGMELGLSPLQAIQSVAVINNRPCLWGDGLMAAVRSHPKCEYVREWIEGEGDQRIAWCETKRKGEPEPVKRSFSVDDAIRAGKWQTESRVQKRAKGGGTYEADNDSPWWRYPQRMLQMRARSWCLRDVYADILKGIQVREEVEDYAQYPTVEHSEPQVPLQQRLATAKQGTAPRKEAQEGFDPQHINNEIEGVQAKPEPELEAQPTDTTKQNSGASAALDDEAPPALSEGDGKAVTGPSPSLNHLIGDHRRLVQDYASRLFTCVTDDERKELKSDYAGDFLDAGEDAIEASRTVEDFIRKIAGGDGAEKVDAMDELLAFTGMTETELKAG